MAYCAFDAIGASAAYFGADPACGGRGQHEPGDVGYLFLFAAIGATDASFLLGSLTFILDIAPPSERTAYTGLANTIGGLLVIAPTIGGIVLQFTSYPVLFIAAGIGPLIGLFVALRLPHVRHSEE